RKLMRGRVGSIICVLSILQHGVHKPGYTIISIGVVGVLVEVSLFPVISLFLSLFAFLFLLAIFTHKLLPCFFLLHFVLVAVKFNHITTLVKSDRFPPLAFAASKGHTYSSGTMKTLGHKR